LVSYFLLKLLHLWLLTVWVLNGRLIKIIIIVSLRIVKSSTQTLSQICISKVITRFTLEALRIRNSLIFDLFLSTFVKMLIVVISEVVIALPFVLHLSVCERNLLRLSITL